MNVTLEFLFAAAGLFVLVWAIVGHGSVPARLGAIAFGILALIIALILRSEAHEDRDWHRDW
jgi:hypothetical protein